MAGPYLYDRVKETTTTTGTGTITLAGAVSQFQSFSVVGDGNTCYYSIVGQSGTEWEVGVGTYTSSGTTLARNKVISSSNSNALVNFSAGIKDVFITAPYTILQPDSGLCEGRLTTESGVPVSTTDRTSQGTLYFTPYKGNRVSIYDTYGWRTYIFSELSLSLTMTSGKNYDVFIYDNSGTLTLELGTAWTNDTTRAVALSTKDGVLVKDLSGAVIKKYLGTIRASGTNVTADSGGLTGTTQVGGQRFVWNYYNQVPLMMKVIDTTTSWSYTTGTVRVAHGATAPLNCVEYVTGDSTSAVNARLWATAQSNANSARGEVVGIGIDSITIMNVKGDIYSNYGPIYLESMIPCYYLGYPGLGYHYISWLESGGDGTSVFVSNSNQSMLQATLWG